MPLRSLYKDSYAVGYNNRDFPTDVSPESCQSLENAFPGPVLLPRNGISKWNINNLPYFIDEIIPWSERDGVVILISGLNFYYMTTPLQEVPELIGTASECTVGTKFYWVRIQNSLYIITDKEQNNASYIITENEDGFVFRNGNITLPAHSISAVVSGAGNITAGKTVATIATLVRREDGQGFNSSGEPVECSIYSSIHGFNPGVLESVPDLDSVRTYENSGFAAKFNITITITGTIDPQATHLRIYRTLEADDGTTAIGLEQRWRIDIPLVSGQTVYTYEENALNDTMAGSLNLLKTIGFDRVPAGSYITYHQGLIWIGGKVSDNDFPAHTGRWYYSEPPQDADFPEKWFSMFNLTLGFKDTSLDDQEDGAGAGVYDNDLIFIMERNTVWKLRNGDPALEPELISSTKGSKFPRTITKIDEMLMYLSNEGPAYIEGDQVNTLREFTAGEVWPEIWDGAPGYFFQDGLNAHDIRAFYFKNTWWIHHKLMIVGMFMPSKQKGFGPLRVIPAWSEIEAYRVAVLGFNKCIFASNVLSGTYLWDFLDSSTKQDNGYDYTIGSISKCFYVNKVNPELAGELYDILFHVGFTDTGKFRIIVKGDKYRTLHAIDYTQANAGADPLTDKTIDNPKRNIIQQGFIEGLIGRVFEVEWQKEFKFPYDFQIKGFNFQFLPLPEQEFEYQGSDNEGPILQYDAEDEERSTALWEEEGKIYDAGDTNRVTTNFIEKDAGDTDRSW